MKTLPLIALDVETGGLYPAIHPLLSLSVLPSWTMQPWTVYVEPLRFEPISETAAKVNGYTHEKWMERGAVPLAVAMARAAAHLADLHQQCPDAVMVAHNAGFDRSFVEEAARQCDLHPSALGWRWRCSAQVMAFLMDVGLLPKGSHSLAHLGELSGQWPVGGRPAVHEAHDDALACLIGYQWLLSIQARALDLLNPSA